jgi:hypothetical protein
MRPIAMTWAPSRSKRKPKVESTGPGAMLAAIDSTATPAAIAISRSGANRTRVSVVSQGLSGPTVVFQKGATTFGRAGDS